MYYTYKTALINRILYLYCIRLSYAIIVLTPTSLGLLVNTKYIAVHKAFESQLFFPHKSSLLKSNTVSTVNIEHCSYI